MFLLLSLTQDLSDSICRLCLLTPLRSTLNSMFATLLGLHKCHFKALFNLIRRFLTNDCLALIYLWETIHCLRSYWFCKIFPYFWVRDTRTVLLLINFSDSENRIRSCFDEMYVLDKTLFQWKMKNKSVITAYKIATLASIDNNICLE